MRNFNLLFFVVVTISISCEKQESNTLNLGTRIDSEIDAGLVIVKDLLIDLNQEGVLSSDVFSDIAQGKPYSYASVYELLQEVTKSSDYDSQNLDEAISFLESHPTIDLVIPENGNIRIEEFDFNQLKYITFLKSKDNGDEELHHNVRFDFNTGKGERFDFCAEIEDPTILIKESSDKVAISRLTGKSLRGNTIDVEGKLKLFEAGDFDVYSIIDYYPEPITEEEYNQHVKLENLVASRCFRDNNSGKDYLSELEFATYNSLNAVANSYEAYVELKVDIAWWTLNSNISPTVVPSSTNKVFRDRRNKFWNWFRWRKVIENYNPSDVGILIWDNSRDADRMNYDWLEIDRPDTEDKNTFTLPSARITLGGGAYLDGPTQSIERTEDPKDDHCGADIVSYCEDASGRGYKGSTGTLHFWIKVY